MGWRDLLAAICLVLVIEGLFLFAAPDMWKRFAGELQRIEPKRLRIIGGCMVLVGVVILRLVV